MMASNQGNGDRVSERQAGGQAALLEQLRQPIAAASNYLGAARLLIRSLESQPCGRASEFLAKAEQELLRAGGIIGRLQAGSKENGAGPR